jgi:hypothetical protein
MPTKTITLQQLHTDYAETIANEAGLDLDDYQPTAGSLANLLLDAADGMSDEVRDRLILASNGFALLDLFAEGDQRAQDVLRNVDRVLYEAANDLA